MKTRERGGEREGERGGEREEERRRERGRERRRERGEREGEREERERREREERKRGREGGKRGRERGREGRERGRERGERELTQISSDHRLKKMCTTFYSQALDATETTTTIETMGGIEFDGNKRPATYAQNGRKIDVLRNRAKVEKMETKGALITKLGN